MMCPAPDPDLDQASGLRRMLGARGAMSLTLLGGRGGVGATSCALNLATAAAQRGRQVLIIDETGRVCERLGLQSSFHLALVLAGQCTLQDALIHVSEGVSLLPARDGTQTLGRVSPRQTAWLAHACSTLESAPDLVIAVAPGRPEQSVISLSLASQAVALLASADAGAMKGAYALIKTLAQDYGVRRFHLIAARTRDDAEADTILSNLTHTAGQFLGVSIRPLGAIPHDPKLAQSDRLRKSVVRAFPDSPAASAYRILAENLARLPSTAQGFGGFIERLVENSRIATQMSLAPPVT